VCSKPELFGRSIARRRCAVPAEVEFMTMKTFTLPGAEIVVPAVTTGLMRINTKSDEEIRALVHVSEDVGIHFVDLSNVYGTTMNECERRYADAMKLTPAQREAVVIQTKCGIIKDPTTFAITSFNFTYEHIIAAVEDSLKALNTDYIDILLLHRPDSLFEPDEVARAFDELGSAGKVRAFGVSNQSPQQIELLRSAVKQPIVANQVQMSLTHANLVTQGIAINMNGLDQSIDRDNGVVDYCRLHNIPLQAWSPFQAGFFDGPFLGSPEYAGLNAKIDEMAAKYGVQPEGIAVAWILRHPAFKQVVLGTTTPARVRAAAAGSDITLSHEDWYELFRAAGHILP